MESLPNHVNGWHVYRLLFLNTMKLRSELCAAGIDCYLNLLTDGISVEYRYTKRWSPDSHLTIDSLLASVMAYMFDEFSVGASHVASDGWSEYIWHVDNWDIQWEELK